jgi:hypothetical protein
MAVLVPDNPQQDFSFLAAPDKDSCLFAISKAILSVRGSGVTFKKIAQTLNVTDPTVANAVAEHHLLHVDAVLRLCYFFGPHCGPIRKLILAPVAAPTLDDRIEHIERELAAIRREAV